MAFYEKRGGSGDRKGGGSRGGYQGGKKFGGPPPAWKRGGDRDGDRPALHRATCSECGKSCEVPFKPTGVKPVFCRDCFRKEDGGGPSDTGYRSSPRAAAAPANDGVARELKLLNQKMDMILKALADMEEGEEEEE